MIRGFPVIVQYSYNFHLFGKTSKLAIEKFEIKKLEASLYVGVNHISIFRTVLSCACTCLSAGLSPAPELSNSHKYMFISSLL